MRIIDPRHRRETALALIDFINNAEDMLRSKEEISVNPIVENDKRAHLLLLKKIPMKSRAQMSIYKAIKEFITPIAEGKPVHELMSLPDTSLKLSFKRQMIPSKLMSVLPYQPKPVEVFCVSENAELHSRRNSWQDLKMLANIFYTTAKNGKIEGAMTDALRDLEEFVDGKIQEFDAKIPSVRETKDFELIP